jgi:succinate-acetate transporter protein
LPISTFWLLVAADATGNETVLTAAGSFGLITAACAWVSVARG